MNKKELIEVAKKARLKAYAPYSNFRVGVALLTKEGKIFTGCNIESVSSGLSLCAEKVAVAKAVSEGYKNFERLVLVANSQGFCSPCGGCRQILYEFAPEMLILMVNLKGEEKEVILKDLLPAPFQLKGSMDARNPRNKRVEPSLT